MKKLLDDDGVRPFSVTLQARTRDDLARIHQLLLADNVGVRREPIVEQATGRVRGDALEWTADGARWRLTWADDHPTGANTPGAPPPGERSRPIG